MATKIKKGSVKFHELHDAWKQDHKRFRSPALKAGITVADYLDIVSTSDPETDPNKRIVGRGAALRKILADEGLRMVPENGRPASPLREFNRTDELRSLLIDNAELFWSSRFGQRKSNSALSIQLQMEDGTRATGTILDEDAGSMARPYTDAPLGVDNEVVPDITIADIVGPTPSGTGPDYRQGYVQFEDPSDLQEEEQGPTVGFSEVSFLLAEKPITAKRRGIKFKVDDSIMMSDVGADAFLLMLSEALAQREVDYVNRLLVEATTNLVTSGVTYTGNSNGVTTKNFLRSLRHLKGAYRPNLIIGHEDAALNYLHAVTGANIRDALALSDRVTAVPRQLTLVNRLPQDLRVIMLDDNVPELTNTGANRNRLLFMQQALGVGLYTQAGSAKDESDRDINQGIDERVISRWDETFTVGSGRARAILTFNN